MTDATALAHIKALLTGATFPSSDKRQNNAALLQEEVESLSLRLASAERERDEARASADAEMERVKACDHIACGDEGWEVLRNICVSTTSVSALRDELAETRRKLYDARTAHRNLDCYRVPKAQYEKLEAAAAAKDEALNARDAATRARDTISYDYQAAERRNAELTRRVATLVQAAKPVSELPGATWNFARALRSAIADYEAALTSPSPPASSTEGKTE